MRMLALVVLCVAAVHAVSAQDWEPRRRHRDGLRVRVAKSYYLPADQVASSPVVVVGGSATIDGHLDDDLVVVGGPVRIGPAGRVRGDIFSLGGEVELADGAEVNGEIHDVSVVWPQVRFAFRDWMWGVDRQVWAMFTLVATAVRFTLVLMAACFLALIAPAWIRRIEGRVADSPLPAALVGVAAEMLILPTFLVVVAALVVTVIGIPLLLLVPFAMLFFIVLWIGGFAAVAAFIGGRLRSLFGIASDSPVIDVAWGVIALFLVTFMANILAFGPWPIRPIANAMIAGGLIIEYFAWTVGLGAALLSPMSRRWRTIPPVPSTAPAGA